VAASFPLAEWIDSHRSTVRHDLASSGMRDALSTVPRVLRAPRAATEGEVAERIAALHGVDPARVFLTHGATEANSFVLFFLAREFRRSGGRSPSARIPVPEYPPLAETARLAGFRPADGRTRPALALLSDPNNPRGVRWPEREFHRRTEGARAVVVDETFREFTNAPSRTRRPIPGLWVTGTFTKVYGADAIRVGYAVAPEEARVRFGRFFGWVRDPLPDASVAAAAALLAHRKTVLAESRSRLRRNAAALRRVFPRVGALDAPVWFDRPREGLEGDALAAVALEAGVLVCAGRFFGDPQGVRLCLTRRTFPRDLAAYREVREAFRARAPPRAARRR
jgi:histidinol-phosphate/aromatic aminotransferase/cobyric acid decarboxylase-like protein